MEEDFIANCLSLGKFLYKNRDAVFRLPRSGEGHNDWECYANVM